MIEISYFESEIIAVKFCLLLFSWRKGLSSKRRCVGLKLVQGCSYCWKCWILVSVNCFWSSNWFMDRVWSSGMLRRWWIELGASVVFWNLWNSKDGWNNRKSLGFPCCDSIWEWSHDVTYFYQEFVKVRLQYPAFVEFFGYMFQFWRI